MSRVYQATAPLEPGITAIEASAGTGKTYNIASLFLRLVVEAGLRVDQILVVTFTRAATAELRDRVRVKLGEALAALERVRLGGAPPEDEILALAARGDDLEERQRRLERAVRDFDTATISTIHGFCDRMLREHAFESGADVDLELRADAEPLLAEIVDDHLSTVLSAASDPETVIFLRQSAGLRRDELLALARKVGSKLGDVVDGEAGAPDWRAAWEEYRARVVPLLQRWGSQEGRALIEGIIARARPGADQALSGRAYREGWTRSHERALLAFVASGARDPMALRAPWAAYFGATKMARARPKACADSYCPPLARDWQDLLDDLDLDFVDGPRIAFAGWARRQLRERLEARREQTYDDMLREVRDRLMAPGEAGEAFARVIRARYRAALIDEFQDTDDTQWAIFERVFRRDPEAYLYLIGDPKQAIYAFRGADVFAYRRAMEVAGPERRATMTVNQRSDAAYVTALNTLFGARQGAAERAEVRDAFGLSFVPYVRVSAAERNRAPRVRFERARPPLQIRWFDDGARPGGSAREPLRGKADAWRLLPELVADDVAALLSAGGELQEARADGAQEWTPIAARHVAVLVRKHKQAQAVQGALAARQVPALIAQTGDVFGTEEALALQRWLEAVASADREGPSRTLAATALIGWGAAQIAGSLRGASADWVRLREEVRGWAQVFERAGFTAALRQALDQRQAVARLCTLPDGERRLTDLRHLVELLHAEATRQRLGPAGLLRWLRDQRLGGRSAGEAAELRLESDADAVRIVTLHKAKGLQYPFVFLPYLWDGAGLLPGDKRDLAYHDEDGALRLDLRRAGHPEKEAHVRRAERELQQENLRLLYVAFTRALHGVVAYTGAMKARGGGVERSPLAIVLHRDPAGAAEVAEMIPAAEARCKAFAKDSPPYDGALRDLDRLAQASRFEGAATIAWAPCQPPDPARSLTPAGATEPEPCFDARAFTRPRGFDRRWRRESYTALTRGKEVQGDPSTWPDPAELEGKDHDAVDAPETDAERSAPDVVAGANVPLFDFPRGKEAGSYVHKVFEVLDFQDLRDHRLLRDLVAKQGVRMGFSDARWHDLLAEQIPAILETPLGARAGGVRLADLARADRLDELAFDLPLAGGTAWRPGRALIAGEAFAAVFRDRREGDVMPAAYVEALQELSFGDLCGFLTGSIDLVYRVRGAEGDRWFVADYKTNRLGPTWTPGATPISTLHHYEQAWMRREMARHHYFIQYHLYLVGLHRFLRSRLGAVYDYDRHVGGAVYLFLRGMVGPDTPGDADHRSGVFVDKPPFARIDALSRLFGEPGEAS